MIKLNFKYESQFPSLVFTSLVEGTRVGGVFFSCLCLCL